MKTDYEKAIEWLNKKAEKAGGITNLGKTVGAPASTFFRVLKGGSPPGADKLLDWISQLGGKIVFPDERMEGYTLIPKVVAQAGAGSSLITSDEVLGMYAFRDDFLRRVGVHAKESVMLDVIGHSMEPMIRHKDTILVDQSVKELRDGDIFLVGFGEELLVKRVQRTPRGWLLKSGGFAAVLTGTSVLVALWLVLGWAQVVPPPAAAQVFHRASFTAPARWPRRLLLLAAGRGLRWCLTR